MCGTKKITETPVKNIRLSHLWLDDFHIPTISLAEDLQFGRFFIHPVAPGPVYCLSVFVSYEQNCNN
jgi:hypothetical protein